MSDQRPSPFAGRTVLALLLFGTVAFVLALYLVGAGEAGRGTNDGGGHAGGKGLNGYAALASLMEQRGWEVVRSRNQSDLDSEDLVILTPPPETDGPKLADAVNRRRAYGPTIVILPKWSAYPAAKAAGAGKGWVILGEPRSPEWKGFADDIAVTIGPATGWRAGGLEGKLPSHTSVQWARGNSQLAPLVVASDAANRTLAAYVDDGGRQQALDRLAGWTGRTTGNSDSHSPHALVFVFEPDLLNNMGVARSNNAILADRLLDAAADGHARRVHFDLTLNGLGRTPNLLTLAFTPPFLAATLCLLLAAFVIAWRAFNRFGPPLKDGRQIAFGKSQLIRNSAGIVLRTGRFHLLGRPYAELVRARLEKLLGLRHRPADAEALHAIDRALAARGIEALSFTQEAARLSSARKPHEVLRAAQALRRLERMLDT